MMGKSRISPTHQEDGFTLIELMVGMVLTGLVIGFLGGGLSLLINLQRGNEQAHAAILQHESLTRMVRQDLQLIASGRGFAPMSGDGRGLVYAIPAGTGRSAGQGRIYFDGGGLHMAHDGVSWPGVRGRFAYFGVARLGDQAAWHPRWDRQDQLPDLIRLTFAGQGQPETASTSVIVRPRLKGDVR